MAKVSYDITLSRSGNGIGRCRGPGPPRRQDFHAPKSPLPSILPGKERGEGEGKGSFRISKLGGTWVFKCPPRTT